MIKFYQVGGSVRDEILGIKSKDLDYSVEAPSFEAMKNEVLKRGGTIFLETPEYLTIRAKLNGEVCDYVLCRKDGIYKDGRHPESVEPGTLKDDLLRRDFTINAMAKDENANIIDLFGGRQHLAERKLVCVGLAVDRLNEDALRILRAIRFMIKYDLTPDGSLRKCLLDDKIVGLLHKVSQDRVREEFSKCFHFNTFKTLNMMVLFPALRNVFKYHDIWLKPTSEKK